VSADRSRSASVAASWSSCHGGQDCIRLSGLGNACLVRVQPASAAATGTAPPMAGDVVRDGTDLCFVPRYPFVAGTTYTVSVDGLGTVDLTRPAPPPVPTTEVVAIHPTALVVPRNLLRCYVWFSAPMSEGYAAGHVSLADATGAAMPAALLPTEHELWDPDRRRLTVLLDPARIKRGLVAHEGLGYPLRAGEPFTLVVDAGLRDAAGNPLRTGARRDYRVSADERRLVEPTGWTLDMPPAGTVGYLRVAFDRSLDHALLSRCLRVTGPDGEAVDGEVEIGPEERWWRLTPARPWTAGPHRIVVDPVLEDLAGNSVVRPFDRDLTRPAEPPRSAEPVVLPFRPTTGVPA
jgi:hypothetical protein